MSAAFAASSFSARFAAAIGLLCGGLAASLPDRWESAPLVLRAWTRLRRLLMQFASLAAAPEAGRVSASPRRTPGTARPRPEAAPIRLPRGAGWLLLLAPALETRLGRAQVESLLDDPELAALLARAPQAGRLLRPLCHALRIEPPSALRLPPRPRTRRRPDREGSAETGATGGGTSAARPSLPAWLTPRAPPPRRQREPAAAPPHPARTGPPAT